MVQTFVDCSHTLVEGNCASCTFLLTPSSDTSFSSLDSSLDRYYTWILLLYLILFSKYPGDGRWSDVETPLKKKKNDCCAAVEIDSGYAGEQPGSKRSK